MTKIQGTDFPTKKTVSLCNSEYNSKKYIPDCYIGAQRSNNVYSREEFVTYKNEQKHMFTKPVKQLILKTAGAIAAAFSGIN